MNVRTNETSTDRGKEKKGDRDDGEKERRGKITDSEEYGEE